MSKAVKHVEASFEPAPSTKLLTAEQVMELTAEMASQALDDSQQSIGPKDRRSLGRSRRCG